LQISTAGTTEPVHSPKTPFVQVSVPGVHAPTSVPHVRVTCSSTSPSQSSSRSLHASGWGVMAPSQGPSFPPSQLWRPLLHSPTSVPHTTGGSPTVHSHSSLTAPSQSSSKSSAPHVSRTGTTSPTHSPQLPNSPAPTHTIVPSLQSPRPREVAGPPKHEAVVPGTHSQISSTFPLQLSSLPLSQISSVPVHGGPPDAPPPAPAVPVVPAVPAAPPTGAMPLPEAPPAIGPPTPA
jgi:hypothetical protein